MSEDSEVTISYLILCHDSPDRIVRLVTRILSDDETGHVVIHFDKNSSRAKFNELKARLNNTSRCHVLENRVRCGWGQWSLVEASIRILKYALQTFKTEHYYLVSEFCYPLKSLSELRHFLSRRKGVSFIDCYDDSWIKAGIRKDRYYYRHYLNKRKYPKLHRYIYRVQKKVGLRRKIPDGLEFRFGSQWWCLTYEHAVTILSVERRLYIFFKYVWIPDECFFQTFVYNLDVQCEGTLTYYNFDRNGQPKVYLDINDNIKLPSRFFFIRKIT